MKLIYTPHSLIPLLLALIVLGSCAPKAKKSETTLKLFSSFSANGLNMDGGALIYGQTVDGAHSFSRVFKGNTDFTVNINYGTWNFSVITYAGGAELTGAKECASLSNVLIQKDQSEVDLTVSTLKCVAAGMRGLKIKPCTNSNFNTVSSGGLFSACGGAGGDGGILSYRLTLKPHDNGIVLPASLTGPCIEATNFDDPPIYIPTGLTGASIVPTRVRAYSGASCSGIERILDIKTSPSAPGLSNLFYARAVGANLNLAINLEGPGIDVTPPALTASTNSHFDGTNHWVNISNQATFSINGACENDVPIIVKINGTLVAESPLTCTASTYSNNINLTLYNERSSGPKHTLTISQTDVAGNNTNHTQLLYKDTIAPTATAPILVDVNLLNQNTYSFNGSCDSPGAKITGDIEGLGFPLRTCNGTDWEYTLFDVSSLIDATITINATITDQANNSTPIPTSSALKDTIAPSAPTSPLFNAGATVTNSFPLTATWGLGAGQISNRIDFYNSSCASFLASVTVGAAVATQTFIPPSESTFSFKVVAVDTVGNETSSVCSNNIIYDVTPPNAATGLTINQPNPTNDNTLDLSWNAATDVNGIQNYTVNFYSDASCAITKDSSEGPFASDFTSTTPLSDGVTHYTVTALDNTGNSTTSVCSSGVEIDTVAPVAPILNATNWDGLTTRTSKKASTNPWSYSDSTDVLNIDVNLRRTTCAGDNVDSRLLISKALNFATFDFPTQGTYFYEVIARDVAGNESSSCSAAMTVNQNAMSLGGKYIDGFVIGESNLYALTATGLEVYDASSPPALTKTSTLRVEGFSPTRAAYNSSSEHIYLYNQNEMYIWTTNSGTNLDEPIFVGRANITVTGILDHTFSASYMWLVSSNTLYGIDISTPTAPTLAHTGAIDAQTNCKAIEYSNASAGDFIYAACDDKLVSFNISSEAAPSAPVTTAYSESMTDLHFDVSSGHMYTTGPDSGGYLKRLNVSSPNQVNPSQVNAKTGLTNGNALGNIRGGLISFCEKYAGNATLFDISSLGASPTFSRKLNNGAAVTCSRSIHNDTTFFAMTTEGIHAIPSSGAVGPVTDPAPYFNIKEMNRLAINNSGTIAFSSNKDRHATVFDLTTKENPIVAYSYTTGSYRDAIFDGVTNTVVAINATAINKIDLTTPSAPSTSGSFVHGSTALEGTALAIDSARRILYLGQSDGQVSAFNFDTEDDLNLNKTVCSGGAGDEVVSMLYKENTLFVTCKLTNKIHSLTASNPAVTFNVINSISLPASPQAGGIAHNENGDILYVPLGSSGLKIVAFAAGGALTDVTTLTGLGGTINSVAIPSGSTTQLFIGKENSIEAFDVTSSTAPVFQGSGSGPGQNQQVISLGPDYIYSAAKDQGIQVFRVTNPTNIHQ